MPGQNAEEEEADDEAEDNEEAGDYPLFLLRHQHPVLR